MVGILVVSHGGLADALIASVQSLVGNLQRARGVSIWPKEKEEEVKDRVRKEIAEVDDGDGVVILRIFWAGRRRTSAFPFWKRSEWRWSPG